MTRVFEMGLRPGPGAMGTNPWDELHKAVLSELLDDFGRVETSIELVGVTRWADVAFWPEPGGVLAGLGLLGRMVASGPCLLEPHSLNPRDRDLVSAVEKSLRWLRRGDGERAATRVWIIAPGRPAAVLMRYGCARDAAWPRGVYVSAPAVGVGLVALRELAPGRETLVLRCLGRGKILAQAWHELMALDEDAPERRLVPVLARELNRLERLEAASQPQDEEVVMRAQQWLEQYGQDQRLIARRETLLAILDARGLETDDALRSRVANCHDDELLAQWLRRAATAAALDEVFGDE